MSKMIYCKTCVIPSTRPNIKFMPDGSCNCATMTEKKKIDWQAREKLFREVVKNAKARGGGYDCLVPVSGGKDSTWQIVKMLEYGLKPLAVTWKSPARTKVGKENLQNLVNLGVDHIDYQISPTVEKKFMYKSLLKYGTTALPMHMAIFNIPVNIAVRFDIPLVVWGENSAFEYGGTEEQRTGFKLDKKWLSKYGLTHETTAEDWVSEDLTKKDLTAYFGPSEEELAAKNINAVFLGYYFEWDPVKTYEVAKANGFRNSSEGVRTGLYDFADIDDDFISIHHYLKWYKFGFSRLFDNLSLEIRNGRMTRDQAVKIIKETGDQTPHEDIKKLCAFLEISVEHFYEVIEKFRNPNIWTKKNGKWVIEDFLISEWKWT